MTRRTHSPVVVGLSLAGLVLAGCSNLPSTGAGGSGKSSATAGHGLGYNYVPANHSAFSSLGRITHSIAAAPAVDGVPAAVDNSAFDPPVGNQGDLGSCVSWSSGYGIPGYLAAQQGLGTLLFSPMFTYTQESPNCGDCGMDVPTALGYLASGIELASAYDAVQGRAAWTDAGASVPGMGDDASANNLAPNTSDDTTNAATYTLGNSQQIFDGNGGGDCSGAQGASAAVQVAISQAQPVAIALPVFPEFDNYDGVNPVAPPTSGESSRGGHSILCTKYDANGLWCQNSWGQWGANGFVQLSWAFVEQCLYEADTGTQLVVNGGNAAVVPVITSPSTGASVAGTTTFNVAVNVPAGVTVASVWLQQVNGGQIGTATAGASGYSVQLDTTQLANGWNGVIAVARDAQGNTYMSSSIEVSAFNQ